MQDVESDTGRESEWFRAEVRAKAVRLACADQMDAARPIGSSGLPIQAGKHPIRRQRSRQKVGLLTAELFKVRQTGFSVISD